ncbi:MAG: IS200/IS605 family transposase [Candidatus Electrothrix sp. AR5]|nr:IS200/IS605 family transposase [Candidatus Electrothrix sp. AR5]
MAQSCVCCFVHYIFSTKGREPWITEVTRSKLHQYLAGIAREHGLEALQIGGTEDHIHALVSLPATLTIAKAAQLMKGGSSKWLHDTFPDFRHVYWQNGYGAFSVSASQRDTVIQYIADQQRHHRNTSFEDEFLLLLQKHGAEHDPQYVFG